MMSRAFRPLAALLSVFILASSPVYAEPIAIREVIQVVGRYQNPPELRLRSISQTVAAPISGAIRSTPVSNGNSSLVDDSADLGIATADPTSLLSGLSLSSGDLQSVDISDEGDVEATICDCGEILVAGGFPKWPLLFLAVIPFIFIDGGDDVCTTCNDLTPTPNSLPTPIPTPTPQVDPRNIPQVPEPASLFLFGSGLAAFGAGLRRRYIKGKLIAQVGEER